MQRPIKKLLIGLGVITLAAVGVAIVGTGPASATGKGKVPSCQTVHVHFSNHPDSGEVGGNWALDDYQRTAKICQVASGSYTAQVTDHGSFDAHQSPHTGNVFSPNVSGSMNGHYNTTFTAPADWSGFSKGPSSFNGGPSTGDWLTSLWASDYASPGSQDWSWTYTRKCDCGNETWVNASSGNSGDITGKHCKPKPPKPVVVTPVAPTFNCAKCSHGELSDNQIVIPEVKGVQYFINGEKVDAGTYPEKTGSYVVTVKALKGYVLSNKCKAKWFVRFKDVPCIPIPKVTPVVPTVVQAVCDTTTGKLSTPSVTLVDTEGITYTKSGDEVPGGQVTVVATLKEGFEFGDLSESDWKLQEDGTAQLVVTLDSPECATPTPTPSTTVPTTPAPTTPSVTPKAPVKHVQVVAPAADVTTPSQKSSGLAFTGSDTAIIGLLGVGLLGLGGLVMLAARRRGTHS